MLRIQRTVSCAAALAMTAAVSGCMHPLIGEHWTTPQNKATVVSTGQTTVTIPDEGTVSDIVRVNKIFGQYPWLSFNSDGSDRIDGFKCSVYLESSDSNNKGVFGNGTLVVTMFRLDSDAEGKEQANPVYEWRLPPDKAYRFRAKEPTLLGWGYGLRLKWDESVDVSGDKVAIVIQYIRDDNNVVRSSRKVLRVPLSGDAWGRRLAKHHRPITKRPRIIRTHEPISTTQQQPRPRPVTKQQPRPPVAQHQYGGPVPKPGPDAKPKRQPYFPPRLELRRDP